MSEHSIYSDSPENMIEPIEWERFPEDGMNHKGDDVNPMHMLIPENHPYLDNTSEVIEEGEEGISYRKSDPSRDLGWDSKYM